MARVASWQEETADSVVAEACSLLRAGKVIGLPSDTGYRAATSALCSLQTPAGMDRPAIALSQAIEVFDWLPHLRGVALRLMRAFWPGPFTLVSADGLRHGLAAHLPPQARRTLCPNGAIGVTLSNHPVLQRIAAALGEPLALHTSDRETALAIDNGMPAESRASAVVHATSKTARIERPGSYSEAEILDALPCRIVFVCTGNTCRSPMAQALCQKMLAERLGCGIAELAARGYRVSSAGLAAGGAAEASTEAVELARPWGVDLSQHRSRSLDLGTLACADFVFAMTRSHLYVLNEVSPLDAPRPRLLSPAQDDIPDPIGGPPEVYAACAQFIEQCLEARLPELLEA